MIAFKTRVDHIVTHPERSKKVRDTSKKIVEKLKTAGLFLASRSPMMFVKCGGHNKTIKVRDYLQNQYGIFGSLYIFPATRWNETGVRFCLNYNFCNNNEQVQRFMRDIIITSKKFGILK